MTVRLLSNPRAYEGVSSDPRPRSEVPYGSTFYCADTGIRERWDGRDWRVEPSVDVEVRRMLSEILEELRGLNRRLEVQGLPDPGPESSLLRT